MGVHDSRRGECCPAVLSLALAAAMIGSGGRAQSGETPPSKAGDPSLAKGSEHVIYIPYTKLGEVFGKQPDQVVLPFAEYQRLWQAVRKLGATLVKPPVPAVITSIGYRGQVNDEIANLQATLVIDVLDEDWVKVPVTFRTASIAKVTGATLAATGSGSYCLLLEKRGTHEVALELTVPLTRSPQGRQLVINGPTAGSTTLDLTIPGEGLDVELMPKLATKQIKTQKGQTSVNALVGATEELSVSWRARSETVITETVAIADSRLHVAVGDGVAHTRATIDYQVLRGELATLELSLAKDERLLDIQTPSLRDWKVNAEKDRQLVLVRLHAPVDTKTTLQVDTERPIPERAFAVGTLRASKVQRETGLIAVTAAEDLEVAVDERQALTRVAATEAPKELRRKGGLYFKFYTPEHRLTIRTASIAPRVSVESRLIYRLEQSRLRGEASFRYDVQRSGLFALRLYLPEGIELERVTASDMERYETVAATGSEPPGQILNLQLSKKSIGRIDAQVTFSQPRPKPEAPLDLPVPQPLDARSERGWVALVAHESLEVNNDPARTKGVRPAPLADLTRHGLSVPAESRMLTAATFSYLARPVVMGFAVKRRQTRLLADTYTTVNIKENTVQTRTTLVYTVLYAGTDTFEMLIPEAIDERVEITGENIKEKRRGQPANGLVSRTVVLHTSTLGRHALVVTFNQPLELPERQSGGVQTGVYLVRPVGVDREDGQVAVGKDRALAITDSVENAEPIDPRQLKAPAEAAVKEAELEQVHFAYRYYRHPVTITLSITKHEVQRVIETVLARALIDTVIPEEGPITYRARYQIRSSQRQRLRVLLPKAARFLGVSVAGRNVLPERAGVPTDSSTGQELDAYLINVSRATKTDEAFPVTILYESPRADNSLSRVSLIPLAMPKLSLSMPRFVGDVTLQRMFWRVWLPYRYTLVREPPGFSDENVPAIFGSSWQAYRELDEWESDWQQAASESVFEFPTVGTRYVFSSLIGRREMELRYGYSPIMAVSACMVALIIFLVTLRWKGGAKLTLMLLAGLAILVGSMLEPVAVYRWLIAAGPGIVAGLVLWMAYHIGQFARRARLAASDLATWTGQRIGAYRQRSRLVAAAAGSQVVLDEDEDEEADDEDDEEVVVEDADNEHGSVEHASNDASDEEVVAEERDDGGNAQDQGKEEGEQDAEEEGQRHDS